MALYDDFPYSNFHALNLDWIVKKLSELENGENTTEESSSTATLAHNLSGNYPYTNFHSLNLDWIIRSMFELESGFETVENEWQSLRSTGLLNDEVKNAILQCFENVAWVNDHGQQYYNVLRDLFFPPVIVDTLTAVLDQGERVFHTGEDVNVIKDYLTVTAELTDGTLVTVPSTQYILTGSLSQDGPNIIVVSYMNASTTITVNAVTISLVSISAVYTQSGTVYPMDSLDSLKGDLVVTAAYDDSSTATVPSADYTLSGTLTAGTSTITVTYEGLTSTFNVTVSEGWRYLPSMGKLTDQDFATMGTGSLSVSESISNGSLRLFASAQAVELNNYIAFTPSTYSADAYMKVVFKIADIAKTDSSGIGYFTFRLSDGTGGTRIGFSRDGSENANIKLAYMVETTMNTSPATYTLNEWHTLEIINANSKQTIRLDNIVIAEEQNFSTQYTSSNRLYLFGGGRNANPLDVYINEIEYREG